MTVEWRSSISSRRIKAKTVWLFRERVLLHIPHIQWTVSFKFKKKNLIVWIDFSYQAMGPQKLLGTILLSPPFFFFDDAMAQIASVDTSHIKKS